eukprot:scaffold5089_cov156-Amphora_coffeaeformis.AAC.9
MGGATSKLDENNWEKADGKLRGPEFTVDGADATQKYSIYYLTKRGVNQREFDITDEESNLLFTTKQVPGTIACFDVLGKGIDTYVLRVTVDIARRYWTVYRYDVPTFEGQLPDKTATQKLAAERIEAAENSPDVETFQTPLLYKKACIVVSWSRYMAVSVLYGPPSPRMIQHYKDAVQEIEKEEEEKSLQRSRARTQSSELSAHSIKKSSSDSKVSLGSTSLPEESETANDDDADAEQCGDSNGQSTTSESPTKTGQTPDPEANHDSNTPERLFSEANPYLAEAEKVPLRKTIRSWIKKRGEKMKEKYWDKDKRKDLVDPSEGIMHLEKPLLLCQEIYTRIIGNHQTSLVSKETVLDLLQQDNAQHATEHPEETDDTYAPIMTTDDNDDSEGIEVNAAGVLLDGEHLMTVDGDDEVLSSEPPNEKKETGDPSSQARCGGTDDPDKAESAPASPGSGVSEHKEDVLVDTDDEEDIIRVPEEDQPLVGYWLWENTLRTHKVKMYVAKGTDLALHVVLAIITNQVRYERNAIAMTI